MRNLCPGRAEGYETRSRKFAHGLRLRSVAEWRDYCKGHLPGKPKLPPDIPASPDKTYKDKGWEGFGDWLGTGSVASLKRTFRPFWQARKFARSLRLRNVNEWRAYCKGELSGKPRLPADIPAHPARRYVSDGWTTWGDWLGTGTVAPRLRHYSPFKQARKFARSLKLGSATEWAKFCKGELADKGTLPPDIPAAAHSIYKEHGWQGYADWLG
jgi:hypothetical protein